MAAMILMAAALAASQAPALAGRWEGDLAAGGATLPLVVRIDPAGAAVLDSPAQGALGIPAEAALEGGVARIMVAAVGGAFEGALSEDGARLTGSWRQGGLSAPLILARTAAAASIEPAAPGGSAARRPQTPQPPFPYRSEEVAIPTPTPGVRLAGTLTTPEGPGPFPAVLLITGSGPQDRDETVFGHKPFLVLADALSRRGVAVLRVDDRGVGGSTGPLATATSADFAVDAGAAFAFLAARPEIDIDRLGLIGHSEGGIIAPLVAAADPRVGFVVLVAGPAMSGGDLLVDQSRATQQAMGLAPALVEANVAVQARVMAAIGAHADSAESAVEAVRPILAEAGQTPAQIALVAAQLSAPWTRWFIAHDPQPSLRALRIPVLAVYGGKDVQVPAAQNAPVLQALLPTARVVVLSDANHLMQPAGTGLPDEYPAIETTFAPEALETIVDWVAAR